ncbi:LuxR family transcriptional regulator [Brevibacterium sp. UCMA 11754]|uniref:LuxR family transcriptional regulator n=1 Tax=Brevibacterium sp. UCMA 11754 TaxID=2749198 RepID=UPI001F388EE8|nr:LuxR family transcriptional regulator [Brevibacterium sp. UCMA 11754]MCF2574372.1 LuxR family transcriptional regulator [Brevibacterium sp. UCMA 11754]
MMADNPQTQNLGELAEGLLDKARVANSGRAAHSVYSGRFLKQALLTLTAGTTMAEHDSPPEATLQVLRGSVTLSSAKDSWDLNVGDLMAIPPERHSVQAHEDSAFLLTIRTDVS